MIHVAQRDSNGYLIFVHATQTLIEAFEAKVGDPSADGLCTRQWPWALWQMFLAFACC